MMHYKNVSIQSRRDFLKTMVISGSLVSLGGSGLLSLTCSGDKKSKLQYKYSTLSVDHLPELQADIDKLEREGKFSDNKIFRSYIENKVYKMPDDFPEAKSIIVLSVFTPLALVNFHLDGKVHEVMISPEYFDDGVTKEQIDNLVQNEIIKEKGYRFQPVRQMMLKRMAVRSGLARYGRNNITYVGEMGTFHTLRAFFTDYEFENETWQEVKMTDNCHQCRICMNQCPNQCIREENFVVDIGRCTTLYNEIPGEFPDFIDKSAHSALMGCMKCQMYCPHNQEVMKRPVRLENVTEEETRKILNGEPDDDLIETLTRKLAGFYPATDKENFPVLTRNLSMLIG